jgi:hypothetical protein
MAPVKGSPAGEQKPGSHPVNERAIERGVNLRRTGTLAAPIRTRKENHILRIQIDVDILQLTLVTAMLLNS